MAVYNLRDDESGGDYQPGDPAPSVTVPQGTSAKQNFTDPPVTSQPNWQIPTTDTGSQVGSGTPWDPGSSAPSSAPEGYTWNPDYASYVPIPGYQAGQPTSAPPTTASTPTTDTGWQIPTLPNGQQYGGSPWTPGSSQPSQTPPGYIWNPDYASYQPIPGYQPPTTGTADYNSDAGILAEIARWSKMPQADPSLSNDPNYWLGRIKATGGIADPSKRQFWQDAAFGPKAFYLNPNREQGGTSQTSLQGYTPPTGGQYSNTNPFSDPATKNYIDLLNSRIQALLTPQQNPQMDALTAYMQKYFQQLQGPTYTPAQQDTIATQQLDPLERQRQAELRNVATTMANRGITPGSGPYLQAERDINQKYDSLRAQVQSGVANNEITLGRQNQSQAVDVGSALASLVDGMNQRQDTRANTAVGYAQQIPNLAQQRIQQAITLLNGSNVNPAQLLSPLANFQQQGINQNTNDSAAWSQILAAFAKAFGL